MGVDTADVLAARLEELRPSGTIAVCRRTVASPTAELDHLAESLGFRALGGNWRAIDRAHATALLRRVLERDLAYGAVEMQADQADALATAFINLPGPAAYFTNGSFSETGWSGHRVAPGTCETGVAWVGDEQAGILWVQDED